MANYVIWASGYPSPYRSGDEEHLALETGNWSPTSLDFEAQARMSGAPLPARDFDGVLEQLRGLQIGSIDRLGIAGHGAARGIGLSGYFRDEQNGLAVYLTGDSIIDIETLEARADDIAPVKDRFAKKASITLFSCSTGYAPEYLAGWEKAFGVECKGFAGSVRAFFQDKPDEVNKHGVILLMNYKVIRRGRTAYAPQLKELHRTPRNLERDSLWLLNPDRSSRPRN